MRAIILVLGIVFLSAPNVLAQPPLKIGLTLGLTGKYSALGEIQQKGYLLWERHINQEGGLRGRPVQVLIRDDRSSPERAATLYQELIVEDEVDFVFGPYSSAITRQVVPVAEKHHYPLLAAGASADSIWEQGYTYVFGVYSPASRYAVGFLELAVLQGLDTLVVIAADDNFSTSVADGVKKWARRFGLRLLTNRYFEKGTAPYEEMAMALKVSKPDVVVICGHMNEAVGMRKGLDAAGWYPKAYFATVGPATEDYYEQLGELSNLSFSSSQFEPGANIQFESFDRFNRDFVAEYGEMPAYQAAAAYAAGELLTTAIKQAGTFDRERIRDVLSSMDTTTIIGRYGVDRKGMQVKHYPLIVQWQDGRKEIVWPSEVSTSRPVIAGRAFESQPAVAK